MFSMRLAMSVRNGTKSFISAEHSKSPPFGGLFNACGITGVITLSTYGQSRHHLVGGPMGQRSSSLGHT